MTTLLPQLKGILKSTRFALILPTAFICALAHSACLAESAATSEWNISADKITRLDNPERIIAEGNIVLTKREILPPPPPGQTGPDVSSWAELLEEDVEQQQPLTPQDLPAETEPVIETKAVITADWISYNIEEQAISAKGNVKIDTGTDQLYAEQATVDLASETGAFSNALITRTDRQLHLEGDRIEKTGTKTYRIEDGWVITCRLEEGEVPPWSFSSAEATVEQGGYAVLKHAKFNIREVPVFYLPYMVVPVKETRQTGLLFPEISSSSRNGFGFNLPFFLNISESADLTLFGEYYSDRGFMPGAEFRYIISPQDRGQFSASYLDDDLSDREENPEYYKETGFTHTNSERYWIRGKADNIFAGSWVSRLDVDVVSDRDYLEEFSAGMTGFNESQKDYLQSFGRGFQNQSDDQRKSSLRLLRSWSGSSLNINLLAINDVREVESSPTPLWQLPSIDYAGALPLQDSPLTLDWDAGYVNYWRDDGVGGHRVDLFPRLSAPVPVGPYLESRAEIGGRGTFYMVEEYGDGEWDQDDTPSRFLGYFHTDLATTLVRDYAVADESYSYLAHSVRPFIAYDLIPEVDQDDLPDFDSIDRIEETNAITYGLDTFFDLYDDNDSLARQYGYLRVEQSYDLRSEASGERFMPVILRLGWKPLASARFEYKAELPIEDEDNTTHGLEGFYRNSRGDAFSFDYRYNEDEDIEQINGAVSAMLMPQVRLGFDIEHSISESETNEANLALTYLAQCWSVQLRTQYTPTDERIMLLFSLANIGSSTGFNLF